MCPLLHLKAIIRSRPSPILQNLMVLHMSDTSTAFMSFSFPSNPFYPSFSIFYLYFSFPVLFNLFGSLFLSSRLLSIPSLSFSSPASISSFSSCTVPVLPPPPARIDSALVNLEPRGMTTEWKWAEPDVATSCSARWSHPRSPKPSFYFFVEPSGCL